MSTKPQAPATLASSNVACIPVQDAKDLPVPRSVSSHVEERMTTESEVIGGGKLFLVASFELDIWCLAFNVTFNSDGTPVMNFSPFYSGSNKRGTDSSDKIITKKLEKIIQ